MTTSHTPLSQERWQALDAQIRSWWQSDLHTALEPDLRNDPAQTLLFLPFPYSSAAGSEAAFPEMYAWDTYFINLALLAHKRYDLVRQHILNYLFMIERYGFMPNGNRTYYLTRSQTPVFHESIWRYYQATKDRDLLHLAYPLLKREYSEYWNAAHHQTPTGLSTNTDAGDPGNDVLLAAEAETGLDFTAIFGADVRQCTPLITNCALVKYAQTLAHIAGVLRYPLEIEYWSAEAALRGQRIRDFCWDEEQGFFFEYNYTTGSQLPFWSLCAYWTLWAAVATPAQAKRLVEHLPKFLQPHGLSFTDQLYPSPFAQFAWVQWGYPAGWPPMQMITVSGLEAYGFQVEAREIATRYLQLQLSLYEETGNLYEKYNVVEGSHTLPFERQHTTPAFHGWSSASAVLLGHTLFGAFA